MHYELIISILTLVALEVVLGIDNIIFIFILASKLPPEQQKNARNWGIVLAMVLRLGLLTAVSFIMKLDTNLFTLFNTNISGKDLILIGGGLFLIYKSAREMYYKMEGDDTDTAAKTTPVTRTAVISQILLLDIVFQ
jgi:predicted tellurium resistance membrane protein TerC